MISVLSIVAGYMLGSVSAAWIITRIFGKVDIRSEADGRISPASVYYRLGAVPYVISALLDIFLAVAAVALARAITHSDTVAMLSGLAAMIGHNWSLFLRFKGGQGATSMAGALAGMVFWPLCFGLLAAALAVAITRRTTISTAIGVGVISVIILLTWEPKTTALYPLILFVIMLIKRLQLACISKHNMLSTNK
ncbi:MAG: glycerol-3-phosphate acyltransferase [Dehalococcoidia bacterium]|nr:glycerol-3-phosphate acyltransferase [Dehalococcoidia bacterium]